MPYWHITLASRGRATLFPGESELRVATTKLAQIAGNASVIFGVVDDHLHDVVEAPDFEGATRHSRRIRLSLRGVAQAAFNNRDIAPVESRSHLRALVRYVLTQVEHHGIAVHPALWSGSCFLDLAGARWLPGLTLRLKDALPRLAWRDLLEMVHLPYDPLRPVSNERLATFGVERIASAAASALNVSPRLAGRQPRVVLARRCVATLVREGRIPLGEMMRRLGWPPRSITRRAAAPVPGFALLAIRRRLALEELVARAGGRSEVKLVGG